MPHQRTVIRDAIRARLLGKTSAKTRVQDTRTEPYRENELPAVAVYTIDESVDEDSVSTAPRELTRVLQVEIAGWVAPGRGGVASAMDDMALQIETAMHADPFLGGAAAESVLLGTTLDVQGQGDVLMGLVVLTYSVTYRTLAPEPPADADMDDFRTADAEYSLGGAQAPNDRAHDTITVQEAP